MEEMISEKNDRDCGSSSCSNSNQNIREPFRESHRDSLTLSMLVTQRALPHVGQLDCAF